MNEPSWRRILELQQEYFIKRLHSFLIDSFYLDYKPIDLSCFNSSLETESNYKHLTKFGYSELIKVDLEEDEWMRLNHFCEEMVNKYCYSVCVKGLLHRDKEKYANYFIGKLGEEAVKRCLGDFITDVDYKIYPHGDGGIDFRLIAKNDIGIQVKTIPLYRFPQGNEVTGDEYITNSAKIRDIDWKIEREDTKKSKILICVLMLSCIQGDIMKNKIYDGDTYNFVIAGFKPTKDIQNGNYPIINNYYNLKIKDLLYGGGIHAYLESLN
ncbi:MAG: hypothetical protein AB1589_28765 [Cyanobacteriota bacterium]